MRRERRGEGRGGERRGGEERGGEGKRGRLLEHSVTAGAPVGTYLNGKWLIQKLFVEFLS